MGTNDIAQLLANSLYYNYIPCGPKMEYTANFPFASNEDQMVPGCYTVVPDQCFHPETYVVIDFTAQFAHAVTLNEGTSSENVVAPRRLVDPNTLKLMATRVANFVLYYFDYVLSYGSSDDQERVTKSIISDAKAAISEDDEVFQAYFLNSVFNYFITEISVTRSRSQVGTSMVTFKDTRSVDEKGRSNFLFFDVVRPSLTQLFVPMLPVCIWARGRFYKDWFFPIFNGYINRVTVNNAQGFTYATLEIKDLLELARVSYEMVNPSVIQNREKLTQQTLQLNEKPMFGVDHMQVFHSMFHGGVLKYDETTKNRVIVQENPGEKTDNGIKFRGLVNLKKADEVKGDCRPADALDARFIHTKDFTLYKALTDLRAASSSKSTSNRRFTITWGYKMSPMRVLSINSPDVFTSTFLSRLEILREVAGSTFYELYVDGYGNVHYHPMRLSNDFLIYDMFYPTDATKISRTGGIFKEAGLVTHLNIFPGVQTITSHESLSSTKSNTLDELVTHYLLKGQPTFSNNVDSMIIGQIGDAVDTPRMARFGYRRKLDHNRFFNYKGQIRDKDGNTVDFLSLAAAAYLNYENALLYTRTEEIVFRPELEVAMPLYFPEEKEVFYVDSITHSIRIGDTATTSVVATFGRHFEEPPADMVSYLVAQDKLFQNSNELDEVFDLGTLEGIKKYQESYFNFNLSNLNSYMNNRGSAVEVVYKMYEQSGIAPEEKPVGEEVV